MTPESKHAATGLQSLHAMLLDAWNRRDAAAFAVCFATDAVVVGFDGSQMNGRVAIERELGAIFRDHQTGAYVATVRGVRSLGNEAAVLTAVAGMVPPGESDINPRSTPSSPSLPSETGTPGAQCSTRTRPRSSMDGRSWSTP